MEFLISEVIIVYIKQFSGQVSYPNFQQMGPGVKANKVIKKVF